MCFICSSPSGLGGGGMAVTGGKIGSTRYGWMDGRRLLHELRQRMVVVGQILGAGHLSVAVPIGSVVMDELGVDRRGASARDVGGRDVLLFLGQQILDEGGSYSRSFEFNKISWYFNLTISKQQQTGEQEGNSSDG